MVWKLVLGGMELGTPDALTPTHQNTLSVVSVMLQTVDTGVFCFWLNITACLKKGC